MAEIEAIKMDSRAVLKVNQYSIVIEGVPSGFTGVQYPGNVDYDIMRLLHSIILGNPINGITLDVVSYKTLYETIKLCNYLGLASNIDTSSWVSTSRMLHCEYIYPVRTLLPIMADFDEYLCLHGRYTPTQRNTATIYDVDGNLLPEPNGINEYYLGANDNPWLFLQRISDLNNAIDSAMYVNALQFYSTYNVAEAFQGNNQNTQEIIKRLLSQRIEYIDYMLIDPYNLNDYFQYTPNPAEKWSCGAISQAPKLSYLEPTIAPYETAMKNLMSFSCGYIGDDFPFDNTIVAGGVGPRILDPKFNPVRSRSADIDIFIIAKTPESRLETLTNIINYFESKAPGKTFYAVRNSVTSVFIVDVIRKFQIISSQYTSAYDIISNFDMTHLQWMYVNGKFYGTSAACIALRSHSTQLGNGRNIKQERFIKALLSGYDVIITPALLTKCNISDLINDPKNTRVMAVSSDLGKYYYPRSEPDATFEELCESYIANIKDFAKCTIVTNQPTLCIENMQLGGIFDNNYEMSLFTGFNVNNLSNAYRNNRSRTQLMAKYGPINITSDMCTVSNVVTTETNMAISLRITEEFNQFLQMLENTVYRMYYRDQVTKKVSCDNESLIITVDIPEYKIANQVKYGNSILISHRGSGLNLEEDLRTGDTVQFSFRVYLINLHNERSLSIDIFKLIKYTNTQVEDIQVPHEDPELTEYTGKIDYAM
jgi:hypothetical protein